ncbi:MAG: hypothetical protein CMG71_00955 [Candidatus Marinimicrobia bacterium]|nr:hypothetical protein [Candidatus Neomarinimicrobiota bacterium]|tara:strand:+ start:61714 stop:62346 length:633 start_codon:yes stop_codon:yes gene_type:complete
MKNNILVVGAGGHCRVVLSIISHYKSLDVVGIADRKKGNTSEQILGTEVKYSWDDFQTVYDQGVAQAAIAVGDNEERKNLMIRLKEIGFTIKSLIHPTALIDNSVKIGSGSTICMGVKIGPLVTLGDNCIIYTGTIIDHEVAIDDNCFLAPGVCIAGRVKINSGAFLGIGSRVKEEVTIGRDSVIGAGAVVIKDILPNRVVAGIPAKELS